jgi:small subunit ribosomal protein S33
VRTGNKYLRQRLKGKALLDYYPPRVATIKDMRRLWPELGFIDEQEEARVDAVERYVYFPGGAGSRKRRRRRREMMLIGA